MDGGILRKGKYWGGAYVRWPVELKDAGIYGHVGEVRLGSAGAQYGKLCLVRIGSD
jgi:hypothetical protein